MNANALEKAVNVSRKSNDPSTKVGCVLFKNGEVVSSGYNAFPRGVSATNNRWQRPAKYKWVEHAERNAIYKAAREGIPLNGTVAACTLFPCADCARALIQVGVKQLIVKEPNMSNARWGNNFNIALKMFNEAGVKLQYT